LSNGALLFILPSSVCLKKDRSLLQLVIVRDAQIISHICKRLQVHYQKASEQMPNPGLPMRFL